MSRCMSFGHCTLLAAVIILVIALLSPNPAAAQFEHRGDLNLNGLPFELADAMLYAEYIAHGTVIFTIDPPAQIAATDINMDGITLSVSDYVMMIQLIMGEPDPPVPQADTITGSMVMYPVGSDIGVAATYNGQVGSLYLEFAATNLTTATVSIMPGADELNIGSTFTDDRLIVLITGVNTVTPASSLRSLLRISADVPLTLQSVAGYGYAGEAVMTTTESSTVLRGDLDLNGTPYDASDAAYFQPCMMFGPGEAFTINPILQSLATDVNGDGILASISDYMYFWMVRLSRITPGTPIDSFPATLITYTGPGVRYFNIQCDDTVSGLYFKLSAPGISGAKALPWDMSTDMGLMFSLMADTARILAMNGAGGAYITPGYHKLFTFTYAGPTPGLVQSDMTGFNAEKVNIVSVRPGDPNADAKINIGDAVYIINYVFKGGPAPKPVLLAGDVNCDGKVNVADAVASIMFVFQMIYPSGCYY